jgi:sulfur relay protein TusB/DsrH
MSAEASLLRDCRMLLRDGDTLLLVDRATGLLLWPERLPSGDQVRIAATRADAQARGLEVCAGDRGIDLIDDDEWVRWVCSHDAVVSWT